MFFERKAYYRRSYSQQGEDLIVDFIFQRFERPCRFFLDIGSNHPVTLSNSYYFYRKGASGICVDPNATFHRHYKRLRPRDTFIACGITGDLSTSMPYYVMEWDVFNTFDKEFAEQTERKYGGRNSIKSVINLQVINVNEFLESNVRREIDFLNLDVEGLDLQIIKAWNFERFSPKVICVESNTSIEECRSSEAIQILQNAGYSIQAANHVNVILSKFHYNKIG